MTDIADAVAAAMSGIPDLSTLPKRMRYAAGVLAEASNRAILLSNTPWTPHQLKNNADKWEEEDAESEAKRNEIDELRLDLMRKSDTLLSDGVARGIAEKLIAAGWRHKER